MSTDRPRVLIVDDHPSFRRAARELFTTLGFDVVGEAEGTAGALGLVEHELPDLVLLDVALGAESGLELARELTRRHPSLSVVLTSIDETVTPKELIASGAWEFIPKLRLPHVDLRPYGGSAFGLT
jgi:two-component system response regulator EvgA